MVHDLIADVVARPLVRAVLWIARGLWWLAWDIGVELVAWSVGWPVCRVLTFGRLPRVGFKGIGEVSEWESALVEGLGILSLVVSIWLLSRSLHG